MEVLLSRSVARLGVPAPSHPCSRPAVPLRIRPLQGGLILALLLFLGGCAEDRRHVMVVSVADQRMLVYRDGQPFASYPVSTSKFGYGDRYGSNFTPLGTMKVRKKIGGNAPAGAVFKSRKWTGEVLPVDAEGRDPIVTRILWLEGTEAQNRHAYDRFIYIHGTPEERTIGTRASYGCIRMRSRDVMSLYELVGTGARVHVTLNPLQIADCESCQEN